MNKKTITLKELKSIIKESGYLLPHSELDEIIIKRADSTFPYSVFRNDINIITKSRELYNLDCDAKIVLFKNLPDIWDDNINLMKKFEKDISTIDGVDRTEFIEEKNKIYCKIWYS